MKKYGMLLPTTNEKVNRPCGTVHGAAHFRGRWRGRRNHGGDPQMWRDPARGPRERSSGLYQIAAPPRSRSMTESGQRRRSRERFRVAMTVLRCGVAPSRGTALAAAALTTSRRSIRDHERGARGVRSRDDRSRRAKGLGNAIDVAELTRGDSVRLCGLRRGLEGGLWRRSQLSGNRRQQEDAGTKS